MTAHYLDGGEAGHLSSASNRVRTGEDVHPDQRDQVHSAEASIAGPGRDGERGLGQQTTEQQSGSAEAPGTGGGGGSRDG